MEELELAGECCAIGRSIGDLEIRSRTGATILAVRRAATGVFDTNPAPDSHLKTGDRIIAIGTPAQITKLEELIVAPSGVRAAVPERTRQPVITELVQRVVAGWAEEQGWAETPAVRLERPAEEAHGDYATPLCLQLARTAKKAPKRLAEELRARLLADPDVSRLVERIDVAGPGFLNFTL